MSTGQITPLVPYNPAYPDIYTDVERSIQQTFKAELTRRSWAYSVFTNRVDEKDVKNVRAALGIMKLADVPDYTSGGGTGAFIKTPTTRQPWAKWFTLTYELRVTAQHGDDVRNLDALIRFCFPPRTPGGVLYLWDSAANGGVGAFTNKYCTYEYAGYIKRDNPDNSLFDRVTNMRFQVPSYDKPAAAVPQITDIEISPDPTITDLDFELSVNSDD